MKKYTLECDYCGKEINEGVYVDASEYGRDFHIVCWETELNGTAINRILGLDIKNKRNEGKWGT